MSTLITILHVLVCLFLMLTVLLQSGKGGGMGGAFGGSNAGTVFGGGGASSFLAKLTAGASAVFMLTSIVLAFLASHNTADALERYGEQQQQLANDKETAKTKAIESGSKVGSGSAQLGSAASMAPPTGSNIDVKPGTAPAGTGITVTPANPAEKPDPTPAPGSAATPPSEKPTPPPAGSAATPPASTGTPAAKPATGPTPAPVVTPMPAKPATPAAAPAKPAAGSAK